MSKFMIRVTGRWWCHSLTWGMGRSVEGNQDFHLDVLSLSLDFEVEISVDVGCKSLELRGKGYSYRFRSY